MIEINQIVKLGLLYPKFYPKEPLGVYWQFILCGCLVHPYFGQRSIYV